jgi:hypothetical protein
MFCIFNADAQHISGKMIKDGITVAKRIRLAYKTGEKILKDELTIQNTTNGRSSISTEIKLVKGAEWANNLLRQEPTPIDMSVTAPLFRRLKERPEVFLIKHNLKIEPIKMIKKYEFELITIDIASIKH